MGSSWARVRISSPSSRPWRARSPTAPIPTRSSNSSGLIPGRSSFIQDAQALPASFARLAYFGNNAFVFVDSSGTRRAFRYQILPAAGVATLDSLKAAKAGPDYLFQDLKQRLARGPVRFRLVAQMADAGDNTSDGSMV
jgi:catalase